MMNSVKNGNGIMDVFIGSTDALLFMLPIAEWGLTYHPAFFLRRLNGEWETVVHDPRLMWTDTLSLAADGYLYVTANQLHRQAKYQKGKDLRQKPYTLLRIHIDAQPILLR